MTEKIGLINIKKPELKRKITGGRALGSFSQEKIQKRIEVIRNELEGYDTESYIEKILEEWKEARDKFIELKKKEPQKKIEVKMERVSPKSLAVPITYETMIVRLVDMMMGFFAIHGAYDIIMNWFIPFFSKLF